MPHCTCASTVMLLTALCRVSTAAEGTCAFEDSSSSSCKASSLLQADSRRSEGHSSVRRHLEEALNAQRDNMVNKTAPNTNRSTGSIKGNSTGRGYSKLCVTQEGDPCEFGVDERDEGSHCITDTSGYYGAHYYGPHGWCWTAVDKNSWGKCSEECPLSGTYGVLSKKLDAVEFTLKAIDQEMDKLPDKKKASVIQTTGTEPRSSELQLLQDTSRVGPHSRSILSSSRERVIPQDSASLTLKQTGSTVHQSGASLTASKAPRATPKRKESASSRNQRKEQSSSKAQAAHPPKSSGKKSSALGLGGGLEGHFAKWQDASLQAKEAAKKLDQVMAMEAQKVEESMTVQKNILQQRMRSIEAARERSDRELQRLAGAYKEWQESQKYARQARSSPLGKASSHSPGAEDRSINNGNQKEAGRGAGRGGNVAEQLAALKRQYKQMREQEAELNENQNAYEADIDNGAEDHFAVGRHADMGADELATDAKELAARKHRAYSTGSNRGFRDGTGSRSSAEAETGFDGENHYANDEFQDSNAAANSRENGENNNNVGDNDADGNANNNLAGDDQLMGKRQHFNGNDHSNEDNGDTSDRRSRSNTKR